MSLFRHPLQRTKGFCGNQKGIAPLITAALPVVGSALSGWLSGWGQGKAQKDVEKMKERQLREQWAREDASKSAARTALGSGAFNYTPYSQAYTPYQYTSSPLASQGESVLAQYMTGQLNPAQLTAMQQTGRLGVENLNRTAAQSGMTSGGRGALAVQLARDLAIQGGNLATQNQQFAVQQALPYMQYQTGQQQLKAGEAEKSYNYGLQDYLRKVQSQQDLAKLLAQYS